MKLRNWKRLQLEIAALKLLHPAPRRTKENRYPARVPVDFPNYEMEQHSSIQPCTAKMGTATACRKKDPLAQKWQRLAERT